MTRLFAFIRRMFRKPAQEEPCSDYHPSVLTRVWGGSIRNGDDE